MQSLVFLFYFNRLKFPEMKAFKILAVNIANKKKLQRRSMPAPLFQEKACPEKIGRLG